MRGAAATGPPRSGTSVPPLSPPPPTPLAIPKTVAMPPPGSLVAGLLRLPHGTRFAVPHGILNGIIFGGSQCPVTPPSSSPRAMRTDFSGGVPCSQASRAVADKRRPGHGQDASAWEVSFAADNPALFASRLLSHSAPRSPGGPSFQARTGLPVLPPRVWENNPPAALVMMDEMMC